MDGTEGIPCRPSILSLSSGMEEAASVFGLVALGPSAARCLSDLTPDASRDGKPHILRGPPCQGWYVQSELRNE